VSRTHMWMRGGVVRKQRGTKNWTQPTCSNSTTGVQVGGSVSCAACRWSMRP
jgi:hypothetical protein